MPFKSYFLVGGAGFLGSHFVDALLARKTIDRVTIYDNFSSGREWHYQHHHNNPKLNVIKADAADLATLTSSMRDHEVVMHFASNPDIARAATDPTIDFKEGIFLTHQVLEATRLVHVKKLLYMSGSGVYGDVHHESCEHDGAMHPISTYGASKLAGEAFISSYCHMFGLSACIFRFANVVGARQTHGVAYDFIKKLSNNPTKLSILGNGKQSKSYIHVDDVIAAVLLAHEKTKSICEIYNVATGDYITVHEIAMIVMQCMNIKNNLSLEFTGEERGWKGDIPIVRLNIDKIRALGWTCQKTSAEAIWDSSKALLQHFKQGLLQ